MYHKFGGRFESAPLSPFLFIAKKRDGAVQMRGLMSRFSFALRIFHTPLSA